MFHVAYHHTRSLSHKQDFDALYNQHLHIAAVALLLVPAPRNNDALIL